MPTALKRWLLRADARSCPPYLLPELSPLTTRVLWQRGLSTIEAARDFLRPSVDTADPWELAGMEVAVRRLRQAVDLREPIVVYGDFDVDGICATALLVQALRALGAIVDHFIPRRAEEGYGLSRRALRSLADDGAGIVLTADCGVRSVDEIDFANGLGLDVVVTDHHSVGACLPDAVAVVNPKRRRERTTCHDLSGVGVAYRVAQALLRSHDAGSGAAAGLVEDDLLDLVALGTVADVVPLTGDNRTLVRLGLERINSCPRPGVRALIERAGLTLGAVDAQAIAFGLGPRLNAAGRMNATELAYELLVSSSHSEAFALAGKLNELNRRRQRLTQQCVERGRPMAQSQLASSPLVFVSDPALPLGILGLIANRLADEFYRPTVVVRQGAEYCRGSARSIDEFHITAALDECAPLMVKHGGHAGAAGFTVRTDRLRALEAQLREIATRELGRSRLAPTIEIDAEIDVAQVTDDVVRELSLLEPCGRSNPRPNFLSRGVKVLEARGVGRGKNHLKLTLAAGGRAWDAIAFRQGAWARERLQRIDVVYRPEFNDWRGVRSLQLNVQDLRPTGTGPEVEILSVASDGPGDRGRP